MTRQPATGACFRVSANVVFMFDRGKETPFRRVCQRIFCLEKQAFSRLVGGADSGKLEPA
jgi:hypothetical protein